MKETQLSLNELKRNDNDEMTKTQPLKKKLFLKAKTQLTICVQNGKNQ